MFTANLFAVLLVYLKEDATEARKLVYGLVLANAGLTLVSLLVSAHFVLPGGGVNGSAAMGAGEFVNNAKVAMVGAALLLVDVLGIILVYEFISRHVSSFYLRILSSLLIIVVFDNLLFVGFLSYGTPGFWQSMVNGMFAKTGATVFYATTLWCYVRFIEPRGVTAGEGDLADVFQLLTYRQKYELARRRMIHDTLTGLYNRLHFDEVVPQALAHARRYEEPLSLMIIDGDRFKSINDRFSHLEGDRVLTLMGDTLGAEVRAADIACRYGGDEFVILLPRTDAEDALALASRVQVRLRETCAFASPPYPWGTITVTVGVACYPADGDFESVEELVRFADMRLYEGKRAGVDRPSVRVEVGERHLGGDGGRRGAVEKEPVGRGPGVVDLRDGQGGRLGHRGAQPEADAVLLEEPHDAGAERVGRHAAEERRRDAEPGDRARGVQRAATDDGGDLATGVDDDVDEGLADDGDHEGQG
jgi:diguanylate cyclase (GGDEF)-like protein